MPELSVNRTLVKSPPELWTELSEVERLANHLGEFGQIRITKVEPEKTVAWEGEHGSGTVEIEASGWGTKVTLTAAVTEPEAEAEEAAAPGEGAAPEYAPAAQAAVPPLEPAPEPQPEPEVPSAQPATAPWLAEPAPSRPESGPAPGGWAPPRNSLPTQTERRGLLSRLFGRRSRAPKPPRRRAWQPPQPSPAQRQPPPAQPQPAWHAGPEPTPEPARPAAPAEPLTDAGAGPGRPLDANRALAVLEGALDKLGSAHHRPFSRG